MLAYQPECHAPEPFAAGPALDADALYFHRRMAADAALVAMLGGGTGAESVGYWLWDALSAVPPLRAASWCRVHRAVRDLLDQTAAHAGRDAAALATGARARLQQFLDENADLGDPLATRLSVAPAARTRRAAGITD
ncbi:MAG TPA: hypothetical protein VMD91_13445 [Candidatus Sulfotelmatobacter sp.]|nr:hypothetical protein [Candidatus Sulfotelmatobacter sp.]